MERKELETILARVKKDFVQFKKAGSNPRKAGIEALRFNDTGGNFHGVEFLVGRGDASDVAYLNTGETYQTTILAYLGYDRVTFKLGNWGDLVESGKYS